MSDRLRRLYHFFSRSKPGRNKLLLKIKKEFQKENNIKKDIINKVAHYTTNNYSHVVFQDDSIRSWQKLFGRRIYQTSIGGLREALKRKASTPVEVGRFVKTTGVCPQVRGEAEPVGQGVHMPLVQLHVRQGCGLVILKEGLCLWDAGETPRDENASAMAEYLSRIPHVSVSMNWEATPVRAG
jgi:hypothetical protein